MVQIMRQGTCQAHQLNPHIEMKKRIHFIPALVVGVCVALPVWSLRADPVNQVTYASLTGTGMINFDDLPSASAAGTNYDATFESGGAAFGERFVGQSLSANGVFDVLSGTAAGSLSVVAGAANQNLDMLLYNGSNVLTGLGNLGYPNFDAVGEGSFAVLFDFDQSEFGFQLVGGNGGNAYVDFFARNGSLISAITLTGLAEGYYGFRRDGDVEDIAGISIHNNDSGGVGFDNLKHSKQGVAGDPNSVPDGGNLSLMLGMSFAGLAMLRRRLVG
jgi:hypothetical protein